MPMSKAKLYPYINMHTGDVETLTKKEGSKLNEDWHRGKMARNENGQKVFRFKIGTQVEDKDGKLRSAVATVDIQEVQVEVAENGDGRPA